MGNKPRGYLASIVIRVFGSLGIQPAIGAVAKDAQEGCSAEGGGTMREPRTKSEEENRGRLR
jgi:hypothetical protein